MELSIFTTQYWTYSFDLIYSFNGFIVFTLSFLISTTLGYQLHKLLHFCADSSKDLHSKYERWHYNLVQTKKKLAAFYSRLTSLEDIIKLIFASLVGVAAGAIYSATFRSYVLSLKGMFCALMVAALIGTILTYRRYLNYKISKLKTEKDKYEAEKDQNINAVLGELTPAMKIGLREKLVIEAQALLDKQEIELKRLDKEIELYRLDLENKTAMANVLNSFKWCNDCMKQAEGIENGQKLHFKCPNKCVKAYFEAFKKSYVEFNKKETEIKEHKEEAKKLEAEEKLVELVKMEEASIKSAVDIAKK